MFRNGELFLLAVIPLLLAAILGGIYGVQAQVKNQRRLNKATINADNPGECLGEDFINCYENILEYVTLGKEAIKISNHKNAIIVIGLTRVGKSTFTQFVANESNPLVVFCEFTSCKFIDSAGYGADSVVSKTFVPNTVEDTVTNGVITPFYDMPGFDDTRNISVEIANSFFMQQVVKNIEKIKIVVVAKHSGFGGTETTFNNLMSFLIKFTKKPLKFKESIVLVANFGDTRYDKAAHIGAVRNHLIRYKEALYGEESPIPNPSERDVATNWINNFLQAPERNPEQLQNVAVFYSPDGPNNGTSIRNIPRYQNTCSEMKQLLWNETEFSPLSPDDIGFTLSPEANLFIERATGESSKNIRNRMARFVDSIRTYLQDFVESIPARPTRKKMRRLLNYINILQKFGFQDCNSSPESSPQTCIHQIEKQLSMIAGDMNDLIFNEINKTTKFLEFAFVEVGKPKTYDMSEWTRGFSDIWIGMELQLKLIHAEISTSVMNQLSDFSVVNAYNFFINGFRQLIRQPIPDDLEHFNQTIGNLTQFKLTRCPKEPPNSPKACFQEIIEKSMSIIRATKSNLKTKLIGSVKCLEFFSSKLKISTALDVWVKDFISLKGKVIQGVKANNITGRIYPNVLKSLTGITRQISTQLLNQTPQYVDIQNLKQYLQQTHDLVAAISKRFDGYNQGGSLSAYIELILGEFGKISNIPSDGIRLDVIYMIERLEVFSWYNQGWTDFHKHNLVQPVFLESEITRFLQELYKNLQKSEIQMDEQGRLHRWRRENPHTTGSNFYTFWMKFQEIYYIDAIRNFNLYKEEIRLYIDTKDHFRNWLNILLDSTLRREETCPRVASGTVIFDKKYVTLRYIIGCLNGYSSKPTRVVALAENTFFFNAKFNSKELRLPPNSKLFIMSRNFDTTRAQEINLSGNSGLPPKSKPPPPVTPGDNGTPGEKGNAGHGASDFIGIFLTEKGSLQNVNILTKGGNGGQGQDGGDGASSKDTSSPRFGNGINQWIDVKECVAWSNGLIQVRVYPNSCNSRGQSCVDENTVNICGEKPKNPGTGGEGGNGGWGSQGGFIVLVNVTTANAIVKRGPNGEAGSRGKRGNDGRRGKWGAVQAKIEIWYHAGEFQKRCVLASKTDGKECTSANNFRNDNRASTALQYYNNQNGASLNYKLVEFKPYVDRFVSSATKNLHLFNRQEMSTFVNFVKGNSYLQGR